jgi:hypothetical protein
MDYYDFKKAILGNSNIGEKEFDSVLTPNSSIELMRQLSSEFYAILVSFTLLMRTRTDIFEIREETKKNKFKLNESEIREILRHYNNIKSFSQDLKNFEKIPPDDTVVNFIENAIHQYNVAIKVENSYKRLGIPFSPAFRKTIGMLNTSINISITAFKNNGYDFLQLEQIQSLFSEMKLLI